MNNQFVLLHERDSKSPIWINLSQVSYITRDSAYTNLYLSSGTLLYIDEHPDDVLASIQNTDGQQ